MKNSDEELEKFLDQLDPFDPENWELLGKYRPLPAINLDRIATPRLIDEDRHLEVNVGQCALGYLKSCLARGKPVKIDLEILRDKILPTWKYYEDFYVSCQGSELWTAKTDFDRIEHADELIRQIYPDFTGKFGRNNGSYGLSLSFPGDRHVILMDLKAALDDKKIEHEFTHFVQKIIGKMKLDQPLELEKIKTCFHLDDAYIDYMFGRYEFWTHVYVDLFNGLQKIYWLNFKNMFSWEDFIGYHFAAFSVNFMKPEQSMLFALWKTIVGADGLIYVKLLAAIGYFNRTFYDEIVEKLKNKKPASGPEPRPE